MLSLAEAIHHYPAHRPARLGLTDRGVLRAGAHADVAVFDPVRRANRFNHLRGTHLRRLFTLRFSRPISCEFLWSAPEHPDGRERGRRASHQGPSEVNGKADHLPSPGRVEP